jgi:hypothetical protein
VALLLEYLRLLGGELQGIHVIPMMFVLVMQLDVLSELEHSLLIHMLRMHFLKI